MEGDPRTQVWDRTTQVMWGREANRSEGTVASALRQIQLMASERMVKRGPPDVQQHMVPEDLELALHSTMR